MGGRQLQSLRRMDLVALLEEVRLAHAVSIRSSGRDRRAVRGGPGAASEVRKWVIALFRYAAQEDLLPVNPFLDVRNRDRQRPRDRVLSMEELAAIRGCSAGAPNPWGQFVQLLMLTGARRNEWASAEISWLDIDAGRLEIPAANYKTGKVQVLPLGSQAQAILRTLPAYEASAGALSVQWHRRARVRIVHLVQVDPVRLQSPKAVFDRGHDVAARRPHLALRLDRTPELCREDDVLAPLSQHFAQNPLRASILSIGIGRVEKGDAGIERGINHRSRCVEIETSSTP